MKGGIMNTRQIFAAHVLPHLLRVAERTGGLDNLLSISLYGSANYEPYESKLQPRAPEANEQDYDVWIVFRQGHQKEARKFATVLFGINFNLLPDYLACILYDKIRLQTNVGELLLAPMIVTEESYKLLQDDSTVPKRDILLPWYRPRARGRPPRVPVCSKDLSWSEFDMKQVYLPDIGLWRLMMPLIIHQDRSASLGTFIECALSGDCFYGDHERERELKGKLLLSAAGYLAVEGPDIASGIYQLMTLEKKAGPAFKKAKVQQFSQWLSK